MCFEAKCVILRRAVLVEPKTTKEWGNGMSGVSERKGLLAATICQLFWGLSFMASRIALNTAPVIVLLSHRFLTAFLVMSLFAVTGIADCRLREKPIRPLLILGLMEPVIYFFGEQYGILHSTTIFSGVMISMIPIFSILAAVPVLKEKPTMGQTLFSLLSLCGVIGIGLLNRSSGTLDWIGVLALLVAVFSAVVYTLLNRGISRSYTSFERSYSMLGIGAVVFTALALISVRGDMAAYVRPLRSPDYTAAVLYLAILCSVVCYFLSSYSLSVLSVARATVFANLTTAVSVLAGALILHEPLPPLGALCCVLILTGIYGVQRTANT